MPLPSVNHAVGIPFIELQSIESTNNYALAQIHANLAQAGACYFAHEQTGGKGQRGKTWATEKGANIILTIVLQPSFLLPSQQFHLSACIAVAAHEFVARYAGADTKIKWPNDIYWNDKKVGGLLIENIIGTGNNHKANSTSTSPSWKWAVVGVGINANQTSFPAALQNPVSLKQITGESYHPLHLAKELCMFVDRFYQTLRSEGINPILDLYNRALYKRTEQVHFRKGSRNFYAVIDKVNESGQLIIHHSFQESVSHGEVEWINP